MHGRRGIEDHAVRGGYEGVPIDTVTEDRPRHSSVHRWREGVHHTWRWAWDRDGERGLNRQSRSDLELDTHPRFEPEEGATWPTVEFLGDRPQQAKPPIERQWIPRRRGLCDGRARLRCQKHTECEDDCARRPVHYALVRFPRPDLTSPKGTSENGLMGSRPERSVGPRSGPCWDQPTCPQQKHQGPVRLARR